MMTPIKEKNILLCIVLSIVTLGIYGLIWFISMTDDMKKVSGDESLSGGMSVVLIMITCGLYTYFWAWKMGKANHMAKIKHGMMSSNNDNIVYLLLTLFGFGFIVYCLVQSDLNKYSRIEMTSFNNRNGSGYQVNYR